MFTQSQAQTPQSFGILRLAALTKFGKVGDLEKLFSDKNMFTPQTRIQNVFKLYKDHVGMLEIAWK